MNSRQEKILGTIIKEYTKDAEPVSSGLLCAKYDFNISPATIRNEMLELEKNGYLKQPHTSAGRVPTNKAYRYFVDNLISIKEQTLTPKEKRYIDSEIKGAGDNPHLVSRQIAKVAADISDSFAIGGIIDTGEFFKAGFSCLFEMPEFREHERLLRITSVFEELETYIDEFFDDVFEADPAVLIGAENTVKDIYDETIIMARYPLPQGFDGAAAVMGPTRMRYDRNITLMKYISEIMRSNFKMRSSPNPLS